MYKLDLSKAKIKEITNLTIPFNAFGIDASHIESFNTNMFCVNNSQDQLIGFASLMKNESGNVCLDLNIEFNSPERLNIENEEFYLEFRPTMSSTMVVGYINGEIKPEIIIECLTIESVTVLTSKQHEAKHRNPVYNGNEW